MKVVAIVAAFLIMPLVSGKVYAMEKRVKQDCEVPVLSVNKGKVTVMDGEDKVEIPNDTTTALRQQNTTCRSGGGYTVCSNGRHGCVWSDRSGKLLGCGGGIR